MATDGGKKAKEEKKAFMKQLKSQMKAHPDFDEEGEGSRGPTSHRVRTNLEWCRQQRLQRQAEYDQLMEARKSIDNLLNKTGQESEWVYRTLAGVAAQMEPGACDGPIPADLFDTSFDPEPPSETQGQGTSSILGSISNSEPMIADSNFGEDDATSQILNSNDHDSDSAGESVSKKARIDELKNQITSTSYEKAGEENDEMAQFRFERIIN